MKALLYFVLLLNLVGCGAGKAAIVDTSGSPVYGTLEGYESAGSFRTNALEATIRKQLCPDKLSQENCLRNMNNLGHDYKFNPEQISERVKQVNNYIIRYNTPGAMGENRSVSAAVLLPELPASEIKGVVLYFHSSALAKANVPSCLKSNPSSPGYCNGSSSEDGEQLAGILAAQGYLVVAPDYVGLGVDNQVIHPYILFPELNALSGLYLLKALRSFLAELAFPGRDLDLYLSGFSEGGSYALTAAKILQTTPSKFLASNHLNLKQTVAISGAYDLLGAQLPMELADVQLGDEYNIANQITATAAKPVVVSYLLSAYGFYQLNQDYSTLMAPMFLNCVSCYISGQQYSIPQLLTNTAYDEITLRSYLASAALASGYPFIGGNSVRSLLKPGLENNQPFRQALSAESLTDWKTTTPLELVYLSKDSVVTNLNSLHAYNGIKQASAAGLLKALIVDNNSETARYYYHNQLSNQDEPIDHSQSSTILLIAALSEFEHD